LPAHRSVAIPFGYSSKWREVNPDIYTFLIDRANGKVCGYINAMPLEEDAYDKVTAGTMLDNEIPGEAVVPYLSDQTLKLYLMSVAVAPHTARVGEGLLSEPLEVLLDAFFGRLRELARTRRIRISEASAIGWTTEGMRICERLFSMTKSGVLSLKEAGTDGTERIIEHPVYKLQLSGTQAAKPARMHRGLRKLLDLYARM
jgi:hypothetical protein